MIEGWLNVSGEGDCPASGFWLSFGVGKVGFGGLVDIERSAHVERFVGSDGVEDLTVAFGLAGEVVAVGDVVAVEVLVFQRAERALAYVWVPKTRSRP